MYGGAGGLSCDHLQADWPPYAGIITLAPFCILSLDGRGQR